MKKIFSEEKIEFGKRRLNLSNNFGAGDLGSNKFHFIACGPDGNIIAEINGTPALGQDMSKAPPFFKPENLKKAIHELKQASALFRKYNISPDNMYSVGTAALRELESISLQAERSKIRRQAKVVLNLLNRAFRPYSFRIISEEEEASWVAQAAIDEFYKNPSEENRLLLTKYSSVTIAHCGGRSTEIIEMKSGTVTRKTVLHYGVHTQKKNGHQDDAEQRLDTELHTKWRPGAPSLLAVGGGIWRAVGKLACVKGMHTLSRQEAEERLSFLAKQDVSYFLKRGEKRSADAAAGAASLLRLIHYTDAQEIVFLKGKMVSAIAASLCDRQKHPFKLTLMSGLQQPSSPSTPSQPHHASAPAQ